MPTDHGIDTGTTIEAAVHQLRLTWFGRLIGELVHFIIHILLGINLVKLGGTYLSTTRLDDWMKYGQINLDFFFVKDPLGV